MGPGRVRDQVENKGRKLNVEITVTIKNFKSEKYPSVVEGCRHVKSYPSATFREPFGAVYVLCTFEAFEPQEQWRERKSPW